MPCSGTKPMDENTATAAAPSRWPELISATCTGSPPTQPDDAVIGDQRRDRQQVGQLPRIRRMLSSKNARSVSSSARSRSAAHDEHDHDDGERDQAGAEGGRRLRIGRVPHGVGRAPDRRSRQRGDDAGAEAVGLGGRGRARAAAASRRAASTGGRGRSSRAAGAGRPSRTGRRRPRRTGPRRGRRRARSAVRRHRTPMASVPSMIMWMMRMPLARANGSAYATTNPIEIV